MATYEVAAVLEHGFWLQILGDHARFILESLVEKEKEEIEQAKYFKQAFDRLLHQVGQTDWMQLSEQALKEAQDIRSFKLSLIRKHLQGTIRISLSPTFLNHMVNEVEEYIRILPYLIRGEIPPISHELHYHLVWLLDAAGHAGAITSELDQVEKRLKEKSEIYMKHFEQFYLKAVELTGYLRTELPAFPALKKFTKDVSLELQLFSKFLHELEELEISEQALGTFTELMADHMAREECYYLLKLAQSSGLQLPDCNPAKPRTEKLS
ncbi:DUF2935 domain-containing protein [Bacillus songklensis]|uniref:DUF2935 domain-containing protein n=1 Tax=Bacillus songklensis TaxID=1069116 RepID=A0ABV8BAL6_9BACI